ncbi:MAG: hypothetical protein KatS3mg110_0215 [Pirellulaceae bacterium]|nr:MAG: hypothetical protein KatS3mg110_0215 [Pirellulaceae bacterium]
MFDTHLIEQQLDALAQQVPGTGEVGFSFAGGQCRCELESVDRIGCAVRVVHVSYSPIDVPRMRKLADQLCRQLHYLVEPLRVVEVDNEATAVQVRSDPPSRTSTGRTYYELLVRPDRLELVRYEAPSGEQRRRISMHLTREVLIRLIGDLTGTVSRI